VRLGEALWRWTNVAVDRHTTLILDDAHAVDR
jgi:hypothetical protein